MGSLCAVRRGVPDWPTEPMRPQAAMSAVNRHTQRPPLAELSSNRRPKRELSPAMRREVWSIWTRIGWRIASFNQPIQIHPTYDRVDYG